MIKPFYKLEGRIRIIKQIELPKGLIERHYIDDNGDFAVVVMKKLQQMKLQGGCCQRFKL